jgi:hypothetical protein
MAENEKHVPETINISEVDTAPIDPLGYVATTDFGRELLAIRRQAIANGMKLLSIDEVLAELESEQAN